MKNPAPLLILVALISILAYTVSVYSASTPIPPSGAVSAPSFCQDGAKRSCTVDSCSGTSSCINGVWGDCKWQKTCEPGSRVSCIQNGCAYAFKECNPCGTGYSVCFTP